jgi:hypothetical protein
LGIFSPICSLCLIPLTPNNPKRSPKMTIFGKRQHKPLKLGKQASHLIELPIIVLETNDILIYNISIIAVPWYCSDPWSYIFLYRELEPLFSDSLG